MKQAELALGIRTALGEGSLWDDRAGRLLWVDIRSGEIHAFYPDGGTDRLLFKCGQTVGTVVQREGGGLVAAMADGFHFIDEAAGESRKILDPEQDKPQNRFNDGKCDPAGRFWAGTMNDIHHSRGEGSLYRLDPDMSCRKMIGGVSVSNGIAWSPDSATMYYTDTRTRVIWAYDYDMETGNISNRRTVVEITAGEGGPDGITIDAEGMLWVAQWGGWQAARYDPATGKKTGRVDVPAARVSSCALGGANLNELYITTAREGLSEKEQLGQPHAGCLFVARVDVPGLRAYRFRG
jgi:sugar lactone lactonase YvrE